MQAAPEQTQGDENLVPMYLTFALGEQVYGIQLERVLEIIGMQPITAIPDTSTYVKGVINLRGKVIPVVDARLRFGLPAKSYEPRTCIIVVQTRGWSVGIVVDRVSDVAAIPGEQTEPPPPVTSAGDHYLAGLGKSGSEVRLLLDVDRMLSGNLSI